MNLEHHDNTMVEKILNEFGSHGFELVKDDMGENNTNKEEKVLGLDIYSKKLMTKVLKIKDIYNRIYEIKKIDEFIDHINKYHSVGNSIHEENGFYFGVMIHLEIWQKSGSKKTNENFYI